MLRVIGFLSLFTLFGCGFPTLKPYQNFVYISEGNYATIVGDGFSYRDGDKIQSNKAIKCHANGGIFEDSNIAFQIPAGKQNGAVPVTIEFSDGSPDLYGLLLVCGWYEGSTFQQNYATMRIPYTFITNARNGDTNVVFEKNGSAPFWGSKFVDVYSWVLWLADTPEKLQ